MRLLDPILRASELSQLLDQRATRLVAVGKASPFMAAAAARVVARPFATGLVVGTHCPIALLPPPFDWLASSHPVPDERSVEAGRRALDVARRVAEDEVLLVLLSGGASALLAVPREGVTLADKQAATRQLLLAGADIQALNTVRKHLSAVKGGQLAAAARGQTVCLAVSDVVSDDPSVIGSGPTVGDPSTFGDALAVLQRYGGVARYPRSVVALLERGARGDLPETPKPGEEWQARTLTRIIGSRHDALRGARRAAEALGYEVEMVPEPVTGEARDAGARLVREFWASRRRVAAESDGRPRCLLAAGETTVRVKGRGRGGRNQELALAAACELQESPAPGAILSGGTDGIDGPTDAAGAIADTETVGRAAALGLAPSSFLDDNDAYTFFSSLSDLVITGPTDTNVGDIQILLTA